MNAKNVFKKLLAFALVSALALTCVFGLASCKKDKSDTVKIGFSGPLTGDAAVYGIAVRNAAKLAVDEINALEASLGDEGLGIKFEQKGDDIYIPAQEHYEIESFIDGSIMNISDAPWPGLTPDLLSVLLVTSIQAQGSVLIHQKMFESRLFFVDKLIDMGAQIILCDPHRAVVIGHDRQFTLKPRSMSSPDIRAGIALLIAAMSADGVSRIDNIEQIDRGYQNLEERLNSIGAKITRS